MSTLTVATVKSNSSSPPAFQNTSNTEIGRLCRAFVNFDGTGTVAIRAAFNVSSITDNGTGDYTVNFTNALADANYSWAINGRNTSGSAQWYGTPPSVAPTAGSLRVQTANGTSYVASDNDYVTVAIFR